MLEKILSKTKKDSNECMNWLGCVNTDGYARMSYKGNSNGKVHRIVYELSTGEDIQGKVVRHKCDNPLCVNPKHLELGSHADNMRDRDSRGRHGRAKLTSKDVVEIRKLSLTGVKNIDLSKKFGVDPRTISSIVLHKHFKHID